MSELIERLLKKRVRVHDLGGVGFEIDQDCAEAASELSRLQEALAAAEAERDEAKLYFDECAIARDAAGFIGTVPECIAYYEGETVDLRAKLASLPALLAETRKKALARRVYLDLDGVMADFDAHFPATFGLDHRGMADDDMWLTINGHASYFRDMPPCDGAIDFFRSIEHLDPIILTACPKSNYAHVAGQKREWVREHLSATATILPVMGGRHKPLFMHAKGDVLIDDFEKNTQAWQAAGGVAILHRNFGETAAAIRSLAEEVRK